MSAMIDFFRSRIASIFIALTVLCAIAQFTALYFALVYAPTEAFMGAPQRIFYFHVPIALICYLFFFVTFLSSILYLRSGSLVYDRLACATTELGLLFATLVILTGSIWGRPVWGVWWTWDPRLTTTFILWLIYMAYILIRAQIADEASRAKYSALIGIIGFIDAPLVHFSVKLWSRGIHPPRPELHPDMATALKVSFVAVALTALALFILRFRCESALARLVRLESR